MLDQKTIDTIKSTSPLLQKNAVTLTRHFYKRMFERNPEVKALFPAENQESGQQQKALAAAICAYAKNIDKLDMLAGAIERIAKRHIDVKVLPEHYPIVGENLLASIKEVLGDVATDDVINAWAQAYDILADILIKREADLYEQQPIASE